MSLWQGALLLMHGGLLVKTHFSQIGKNEKKLKVQLSWQLLAHFSETFSTHVLSFLKVKQNILCPHWDRTKDL